MGLPWVPTPIPSRVEAGWREGSIEAEGGAKVGRREESMRAERGGKVGRRGCCTERQNGQLLWLTAGGPTTRADGTPVKCCVVRRTGLLRGGWGCCAGGHGLGCGAGLLLGALAMLDKCSKHWQMSYKIINPVQAT